MSSPVAFVTGASRGIGAATTLALAEAGHDVAITARTLAEGERHEHGTWQSNTQPLPGSLEATAAAVRERGRTALPLQADILDPDSVPRAIDAALTELGRIDVLVNNACYQGPGNLNRVLDIEPAQLAAVYQGNVQTPLAAVQRVLPQMVDRGGGVIVNMVSRAAQTDPPRPADEGGWGFAYSSSKAALIRMAGCLAVEHADSGVSVYNVEPGFVVTEVMKANGLLEGYSDRDIGTRPETIAAVIRWLCEDPAAAEWHGGPVVPAPRLARDLGLEAA